MRCYKCDELQAIIDDLQFKVLAETRRADSAMQFAQMVWHKDNHLTRETTSLNVSGNANEGINFPHKEER